MRGESFARSTAAAVLARLGGPAAKWRVLSVDVLEPVTAPPDGLTYPVVLLVSIGDDIDSVGVHFTVDVDEPAAVAAVAEQIQDHVLEASQGALLPQCPGHPHPLTPRVVHDVAMWVCPKDVGHHAERVLEDD